MNATRKSNSIITHELLDGNVLRFTVVGAGSFDFDPSGCTDETEVSATLHGYVQKISDKAAIGRDTETGRPASPQAKFDAMKNMADHLAGGGAWIMRQAAKPRLNRACVFAAVATVFHKDPVAVEALWRNMPDDVLKLRLSNKDVAAEYARLTASGKEPEGLFEGLSKIRDGAEAGRTNK